MVEKSYEEYKSLSQVDLKEKAEEIGNTAQDSSYDHSKPLALWLKMNEIRRDLRIKCVKMLHHDISLISTKFKSNTDVVLFLEDLGRGDMKPKQCKDHLLSSICLANDLNNLLKSITSPLSNDNMKSIKAITSRLSSYAEALYIDPRTCAEKSLNLKEQFFNSQDPATDHKNFVEFLQEEVGEINQQVADIDYEKLLCRVLIVLKYRKLA
jgi:hypothetical protein